MYQHNILKKKRELEKDTRLDQQGPDTFVTFQETDILGIRSFCRLPKTWGVAVTGKTCRSFASHKNLKKKSRESKKNIQLEIIFPNKQLGNQEILQHQQIPHWMVATQTFFLFTPNLAKMESNLTFIFSTWVGSTTKNSLGFPMGNLREVHTMNSCCDQGRRLDEGHWSCQCSRTTLGILHCSWEA